MWSDVRFELDIWNQRSVKLYLQQSQAEEKYFCNTQARIVPRDVTVPGPISTIRDANASPYED